MTSQLFGNDEQLDRVAEEVVDRFRRGEYPSLDEYCRRHPDLATQMRELFPALVEMARAERAMGHTTAPLRQVGDYRIIREVGRGGMGVVYEAEQALLGRRVAIKVLSQRSDGDVNSVERFRREARAAARLHHTNIVPVFDIGRDGDVCYYAMQFITGQGIDKVIHELRSAAGSTSGPPSVSDTPGRDAGALAQSVLTGAFYRPDAGAASGPSGLQCLDAIESLESASDVSSVSLGQAELSAVGAERRPFFESVARIGRQTASALAHAHERGVIHRDVKPSNLLLDASGAVWVTDFGLAKTDEADLTRTGDILGTIRYMSPERFQGCGDARGDIYALGMTLRELLVLRPAFESADRAALVAMIANEEPARPRAIDSRIPGDLETIVLKATAKEPGRRYQTADEMAEDLRRFLDGEPIKARRVGALGRARLFCRRNPALALLYGVLFAVALGASAATAYLSVTVRDKERAERRAVEELISSFVAQADASRSSRRVGQRFRTLETVKKAVALASELDLPPERLDPLRTVAVAALALPDFQVADE